MSVSIQPPLRVLLLMDRLQIGGPGRVLVTLATGLRAQGADARVAHLGIGDWSVLDAELRASGVPVINLRLGSLLDPRIELRLARYLCREAVDVVHTHNRYAHLVGRVAGALAGRPVVSTIHHITEEPEGWRDVLRRHLDYASARVLRPRIVTVAEAQRQAYRRAAGVDGSRVVTVFNGVDTSVFKPDAEARFRVRGALGVVQESPLFITVSRLIPGKGVRFFIEAAAEVRRQVPAAAFVVVGDGPERPRLEAMSADFGLQDAVHFAGTRSDVPAFLAAADVYVHPSLFEALPTSILEAMAVGLPVVAARVGGVPEIVVTGRTGILVSPASAEELARAMVCLVGEKSRAALGSAGRAWVEKHASLELWVKNLRRVYEDAALNGREPRAERTSAP